MSQNKRIETQGKTPFCFSTCSDENFVAMQPIDPSKSYTCRAEDIEETIELLDKYWFFDNLLHSTTRMFRSSSDPYPSTKKIQDVVNGGQSSTSSDLPTEDGFVRRNLRRAPSLPPHLGMTKEDHDKEIVRRSNKLTRRSSLNSSDVFDLPPLPISKTMPPSSSIRRHRTRSELKVESGTNKDITNSPCLTKELIYRSLSYNKVSKSLSDLEFEEVQGFKDLGFVFDKDKLNPDVVNIIPGLQGKKTVNDRNKDKVRRPYLSEAWLVHSSFPQMPYWIDQCDAGDVKSQLKFWARAVASNVRQEC